MVTPSQSLGPFYPSTIPLDSDADLTVVSGRDGKAAGEITNYMGRYSVPMASLCLMQELKFGSVMPLALTTIHGLAVELIHIFRVMDRPLPIVAGDIVLKRLSR